MIEENMRNSSVTGYPLSLAPLTMHCHVVCVEGGGLEGNSTN